VRVERGTSQIFFGLLPDQTADLAGRVWRVDAWVDPVPLTLDQEAVRAAIIRELIPWTRSHRDNGLADQLSARTTVEVVQLNKDRGVRVESFPKQWRCKACNRIEHSDDAACKCGARAWAQMQFVAYHDCGAAREPTISRCPEHHAVAVRLPGTARARELLFYCPECQVTVSQGFPFQSCTCGGGGMTITVHRAAVVFSPRFTVLVNPPDPVVAARLRANGGGARALEWILDDMSRTDPTQGRQTFAGLVEMLRRSGLSEETAQDFARQAVERGEVDASDSETSVVLPDRVRDRAHEEALALASAVAGGRMRVSDMIEGTTPPLRTLYESAYADALHNARLVTVDLLSSFPVVTLAFGYTRGDPSPGAARLVPFKEKGRIRAYGLRTQTEALLFQLDPNAVYQYLVDLGHHLPPAKSSRDARLSLMGSVDVPWPAQEKPQPLGRDLVTLLHSYAHRTIRRLASFAGIERDALAEYLLPHHLSFIVYAAVRGEFVLGGLQAVFETNLHRFLDDLVYGETRCPLDPGCYSGGGACMACLHLGEPSCRWFNRFLDRSALFGSTGFLTIHRDRQ